MPNIIRFKQNFIWTNFARTNYKFYNDYHQLIHFHMQHNEYWQQCSSKNYMDDAASMCQQLVSRYDSLFSCWPTCLSGTFQNLYVTSNQRFTVIFCFMFGKTRLFREDVLDMSNSHEFRELPEKIAVGIF